MFIKDRFIGFVLLIIFSSVCYAFSSTLNCGHKIDNHGIDSYFCTEPVNMTDCRKYDAQCSDWCQNNINWTVKNSDIGLIEFSLPNSPATCCHSVLRISLFVFDETHCNGVQSCDNAQSCDCVHSVKRIQRNCSKTGDTEILKFEVKYVFSSWYHLEIKPYVGMSIMQPCKSNKMLIVTNYEKRLIGNAELGIQYDYKHRSQDLYFGIGGGNLHLAEQVSFKLIPGCRDNLGVTIFLKNGEDSGECCKRNYTKFENCSCEWTDKILVCNFSNIQPGNYCVTVELEDPRCARPTLWANATSCQWNNKYNISAGEKLIRFKPPGVNLGINTTLIWISVVGCIFGVIVAIIICIYFRSSDQDKIYEPMPLPVQQFSLLKTPKILLLYPRDCDHFMTVMENFRTLLQEFLHAEVYDVWDLENWDSITEIGYQWVSRYLLDKNFKVIIVASECSKLFETAIFNSKGVEYIGEPNCLDNIFLYSLKESITLVSCSDDNYKRFFVIRLEESGCEEYKFSSITPCRVYTIPQHLKDLTYQIHNMNLTEVILNPEETSKIKKLIDSLEELKKFKLNNPSYLKDLVCLVDEENR